MNLQILLPQALSIAQSAAEKILEIYQSPESIKIFDKADHSPLTTADLAANKIITEGLGNLTPHYPVLSEESEAVDFKTRRNWEYYWLVDPLDGTKEFIQRTDEFTINIALIENHKPILGIVLAPALQLCYYATKQNGAFKQENKSSPHSIHVRKANKNSITVVSSRRHGLDELKNFLANLPNHNIINRGSALKCCLVAEGEADIYPRFGPTSEWDIAAGQCILEQAGGCILDLTGKPLRYNTKDSLENPSFLAIGDPNYPWINN